MYRLIFFITFLAHGVWGQQKPVGMIEVSVNHPQGLQGVIEVKGPGGYAKTITSTQRLENLADGSYTFTGKVVIQRESSISKAFRPLTRTVMVKLDTQKVNMAYRLMPGSDKIWLGNQNAPPGQSLHILAFADERLTGSQTSEATVKLTGQATSIRSLAFDTEGNLWVADAGQIKMYPWNKLGDTRVASTVNISQEAACLAFDRDGNLWISDGKTPSRIMRIPKANLSSGGGNKTDIILTGAAFKGAQAIAFDAQGNLWVANYGKHDVVKIPADRLRASDEGVNELQSITCMSKPPVINTLSSPKGMAFDRQGNLWVGYFGPNVIVQIPAAQLAQSGKITPDIQITLNVSVLLHQLAFDEDGNLWTAMGTGAFGKLTPDQLTSTGKKAPAVVISSPDLKYGSGLAIFPQPAGYPLPQVDR